MDTPTQFFRSILLALAGNRAVEALALKYGLKLGASQFVAGESLEEALEQVRLLNAKGILTTLDHLGEGIRQLSEAAVYKDEYIKLLHHIRATGAYANVSLKPTQLGLALDPEAAYTHIREIVTHAKSFGNFVRMDMENSPYTDATIQIMKRLHTEGLSNVGTVIQAYLYRSEEDIHLLTEEGFNLRLVKGAYKEAKSIAYPKLSEVDENFKRIIAHRLRSTIYTGVATHDEKIIEWVKSFVKQERISRSTYEFQMLYGIRMPLQERLAREGYTVRCYVPYGRMWYPYFVRRLAERPANMWFLVKNMIKR
ncbi:proline dehydrogenase [Paenibacillus baekrokdamisoli]|uniref:proline dehydrogenase n=1 Tax=Paenibacillus baekrokdamisoli TaxID=1712516 RepID=A0A3G9JP91_9BACL|nr:proline dehydrogenase family protein [Paenibacillus baekrokdamisoli]MBB3069547.1 proline dehydrogenase [Paenibacillus baekrokdamisoli]BBH24879.1 proline dehydrogenase [Paenibacillus baekrokdamisoli]